MPPPARAPNRCHPEGNDHETAVPPRSDRGRHIAHDPLIVACTDNAPDAGSPGAGADPRALTVQATDTECRVSATTAPSGNLTFSVTNGGAKVTEFYLLAGDGLRIIGEIENIGPGLSRDLVLRAGPGDYRARASSPLPAL